VRDFDEALRQFIDLVPSRRREALLQYEAEADPGDMQRFVNQAANLQMSVCIELCHTFANTTSSQLVKLLGIYANRQESELREKALDSLARISAEAKMSCMIDLLESTFFEVRLEACKILGLSASPAPNSALLRVLSDGNVQVVLEALEAVRKLRFKGASSKVTTLLGHEDNNIKIKALEVLVDIAGGDGFPSEEVAALAGRSEDNKVKSTCCWALGRTPSEAGEKRLLAILQNDSSVQAVIAAAAALSSYHEIEAVRALLEKASSTSATPAISLSCRRALNRMPEDILLKLSAEMMALENDMVRMETAAILGELSFEGAKQILLERLAIEKDDLVKGAILEALGHGGWLDTWELIKSYLGKEAFLSYAAVTALGDLLESSHAHDYAEILDTKLDATNQEAILKRLYMYGLANQIPESVNEIIRPLFFSDVLNVSILSVSVAGRMKEQLFISDIFKVMASTESSELKKACSQSLLSISDGSLDILIKDYPHSEFHVFADIISSLHTFNKNDTEVFSILSEKSAENVDGAFACLCRVAAVSPSALLDRMKILGDNPLNISLLKAWKTLPEEIKNNNAVEFSRLLDSVHDEIRLSVIDSLPEEENDFLLGKLVDIALSDENEDIRVAARAQIKIFIESAF
jgi:HEAT repeat protein